MTPIQHQLYQHRYGGIYFVEDVATHTGTKQRLVIYTHVYPFEHSVWARPIEEWTADRFRAITPVEMDDLMSKDRKEFQEEINKARAAAKS